MTEKREAEEVKFEDVAEEIKTYLLNEQKRETIHQLLGKRRKVANVGFVSRKSLINGRLYPLQWLTVPSLMVDCTLFNGTENPWG